MKPLHTYIIALSLSMLLLSCNMRHHFPADVRSWGYVGQVKESVTYNYGRYTYANGQYLPDTTTLYKVQVDRFDREGKMTARYVYKKDSSYALICTRFVAVDPTTTLQYWWERDSSKKELTLSRRRWANDSTLYYEDWDTTVMNGEPGQIATVWIDKQYRLTRIINRYSDGCVNTSYRVYSGDTITYYDNVGEKNCDTVRSIIQARDAQGNITILRALSENDGISISTCQYY